MNEFNSAPDEAKVYSLSERRNKEISKHLKGFEQKVTDVREMIKNDFNDLNLLIRKFSLEDPIIVDNVVDIGVFRKNKKLLDQPLAMAIDKKETILLVRDLLDKIKDAMIYLYKNKFKEAMELSHGLSESEFNLNLNFIPKYGQHYSDEELREDPVGSAMKKFIPNFISYLKNVDLGVARLVNVFGNDNPNLELADAELCAMRNQLQGGLQYVEYYLAVFDKNNTK